MTNSNDLTQDWPTDTANDELLRLAEHLRDVVSPLPANVLARIEEQMQAEIARAERRIGWRRVALGWSIAACIVLALGSYAYLRSRDEVINDRPQFAGKVEPAAPIDDRITVAIGHASAPPASEKPLVALDEYRSLFAD